MSRYDESHDVGDLSTSTRKLMLQILVEATEPLRLNQVQYRLGHDLNQTVSLREIEATLNWMVHQPLTDSYRVVFNRIARAHGAVPTYSAVPLKERHSVVWEAPGYISPGRMREQEAITLERELRRV